MCRSGENHVLLERGSCTAAASKWHRLFLSSLTSSSHRSSKEPDINPMQPSDIIDFWFQSIKPAQWWAKDRALDELIAQRFGAVHTAAARCELHSWRSTAAGRLAEVIVLDQFSRNLFRDSALAFAQDPLALALAQEAVATGADAELSPVQRAFLYMPYMHSESLAIHEMAVELFRRNGIDGNLQSELRHKNIIERFGRYPHRNAVLGRVSTPAEIAFLRLREPNSRF